MDVIIENVGRLALNNALSGHTQWQPSDFVAHYWEGAKAKELERFADWAVDLPDGSGWRISDNGLPKIIDAMALALDARTPEEKLIYVDMALNVVHQRSDLAAWFVDGGVSTLQSIAPPTSSRKTTT